MQSAIRRLAKWSRQAEFASLPATFCAPEREALPALLAGLLLAHPRQSLVAVAADASQADLLAQALADWGQLLDDPRPQHRVAEVRGLRREWMPENEAARCAALDAALSEQPGVFVAEAASLLPGAVPPANFRAAAFAVAVGQTLPPEALAERLLALDYDNEPQVSLPGEFSRRGGILDLYSPVYDAPCRLEFFGDQIDTIRFFDPESQRSFKPIEQVRIVPRGTAALADQEEDAASLLDYFPTPPLLALCNPAEIAAHLQRFGDPQAVADWQRLADAFAARQAWLPLATPSQVQADPEWPAPVRFPPVFGLSETRLPSLPELGAEALKLHWQLLRDNLRQWHRQGLAILACCGNDGEAARLRELLDEDSLTRDLPVDITPLALPSGVLFPNHKLILLSDRELFGKRSLPPRRHDHHYRTDYEAAAVGGLEEGCYAVHAGQGVCLYHGIRTIEVAGQPQEAMELEFAEHARLYVPLDQAALVSRYVGGTKKLPKLNRIGSAAWKSAKASAAASAYDLAAELLRLEAIRQQAQGCQFVDQGGWERDFAAAFPYRLTEDQSRAIDEVLADMGSSHPMDRLLCGDVGYGKTEVAMRAAFRAVMNGRQVAVLVPTTILAQQHYDTFRDRMAEYPVVIDLLSRFRTGGEQRQLLERLALGQVDIVIGTHRLVQSDVAFADLGLLIIDEEQRFGVKHKERLKHLRASVDILTMTATPIPRTLYFSLSGLRHLSTIMTAPAERLPVKTIIAQDDPQLIRQAIVAELEREGQVFFLHNRVQTIDYRCQELARLLPEARLAVAHGQMPPHQLESIMLRFLNRQVDVLVCTTIIESGLDIPNANTILIDDAQRFGLAELYQLRGRVGRFHNQAYAYLLLPPSGVLPANARDRLAAVRQYTHLGAGFKLALRDLEIRGAGNILGQQQSGQIAAVGFDLYCELLRSAVAQLENQTPGEAKRARVTLDTVSYGLTSTSARLAAALPPDYIDCESLRVDCYKRLQQVDSPAALADLEQELRDRFGPPPPAVHAILGIQAVRLAAEAHGFREVNVRDRQVLVRTTTGYLQTPRGKLPCLNSTDPQAQLTELVDIIHALAPPA